MDLIENSLKIAQQLEGSSFSSSLNQDDIFSSPLENNKFSNIIKLYEYQVVEMQHEYELLLEDKVIFILLLFLAMVALSFAMGYWYGFNNVECVYNGNLLP